MEDKSKLESKGLKKSLMTLIIMNSTGYSVKNFAVFVGIVLGFTAGLAFITLLFLDFFYKDYTLSINLASYALVIGALEGIIAVLLGLKVWSEKYENK